MEHAIIHAWNAPIRLAARQARKFQMRENRSISHFTYMRCRRFCGWGVSEHFLWRLNYSLFIIEIGKQNWANKNLMVWREIGEQEMAAINWLIYNKLNWYTVRGIATIRDTRIIAMKCSVVAFGSVFAASFLRCLLIIFLKRAIIIILTELIEMAAPKSSIHHHRRVRAILFDFFRSFKLVFFHSNNSAFSVLMMCVCFFDRASAARNRCCVCLCWVGDRYLHVFIIFLWFFLRFFYFDSFVVGEKKSSHTAAKSARVTIALYQRTAIEWHRNAAATTSRVTKKANTYPKWVDSYARMRTQEMGAKEMVNGGWSACI